MIDFDGVIADSLETFFPTFTELCTEMGFDRMNSRESFLKLFEANNLLQELVRKGFPVWRLKKLLKALEPRVAALNKTVPAFAGMPALLCDLAAAHPSYVVTSNMSATVEAFLERYGVGGIRDVLGVDKDRSKVKKIRALMKAHPGCEAYYIGDTKGDMLEARKAKCVAVAAAWGWHSVETLREGGPDHVLHSPAELRALLL